QVHRIAPIAWVDPNAVQLGVGGGGQGVWGCEDVDVDGGLVAGAVDVCGGGVFGAGAFDDAGSGSGASGGHEVGQDEPADGADEVDGGVGDDACGLDGQVAGGVQGGGGPGRVGMDAGWAA